MKANKLVFSAFFLALMIQSLNAYSWRTCNGHAQLWKSNTFDMYINTYSFPAGGSFHDAILEEIQDWNDLDGQKFHFVTRDQYWTSSTEHGNRKSEMIFTPDLDSNIYGRTMVQYDCYRSWGAVVDLWGYYEADILMNSNKSWHTDQTELRESKKGDRLNFHFVMAHELGHALGLQHSDNTMALMNTYYPGGGVGHSNDIKPHADDQQGVRRLYGNGNTVRAVLASNSRNIGDRQRYNIVTNPSSSSSVATLFRGNEYEIEYTMENAGTYSENIGVKFYISTNNYISSFDTYVGESGWSLMGSHTAKKRFTVPSSIAPGTYYIGYVLTPDTNSEAYATGYPEDGADNFVALKDPITIQ